jgi:ferredoxin
MKLASKTDRVEITFVDRDGDRLKVQAQVGQNLLEVAQENGIDLEGACEGVMACSTCHLIIDPDFYCKLDDEPTEEEMDMLDLAYGLTDT